MGQTVSSWGDSSSLHVGRWHWWYRFIPDPVQLKQSGMEAWLKRTIQKENNLGLPHYNHLWEPSFFMLILYLNQRTSKFVSSSRACQHYAFDYFYCNWHYNDIRLH